MKYIQHTIQHVLYVYAINWKYADAVNRCSDLSGECMALFWTVALKQTDSVNVYGLYIDNCVYIHIDMV